MQKCNFQNIDSPIMLTVRTAVLAAISTNDTIVLMVFHQKPLSTPMTENKLETGMFAVDDC